MMEESVEDSGEHMGFWDEQQEGPARERRGRHTTGLRAGAAQWPDCDEEESDSTREWRSEEKKPGRIGRFFLWMTQWKDNDGRLANHEVMRVYSRASHRKIPDSPSGGGRSFFIARKTRERGSGSRTFQIERPLFSDDVAHSPAG
jgi:hypothetical protein